MCSPAVFDPLRTLLRGTVGIHVKSWMTAKGPWTIEAVASTLAQDIARTATAVVVLGHSTGGAIALELATRHPDVVRGLVLINTGPHMKHHGDISGLLALAAIGDGHAIAKTIIQRSFYRRPGSAAYSELMRYAKSVDVRAIADVLQSQRRLDFTDRLPSLRVPVAVVHGRHDPVRGLSEARELAALIPSATLYVAEAGHTPMFEDPETVATALLEVRHRVGSA